MTVIERVRLFHRDILSDRHGNVTTPFVGLDSVNYGKLTLGDQYDFMVDSLFFGGVDAAMYGGGLCNFRAGPFSKLAIPYAPAYAGSFDWDRMSGETVTNSLKYQSPSFGGFRFGPMYGFGNVPGHMGSGNAVSADLNYDQGPLSLAAAYTEVKYLQEAAPQVGIRNWSVGARYNFGKVIATAMVTNARNAANGAAVAEGEIGASYRVDPALSLSANYMYMKGNGIVDNNHAHQVTAVAGLCRSGLSAYQLGRAGVDQRGA
ncbi:porin [Paraburkholderia fynbosensis]|uniref:porin n=1 Tax=Paraburkholderia fynbosensis TaxID=1200993 RepID=UPI0015817C29|nr:porin [Paraburkholderia fynbosensis]